MCEVKDAAAQPARDGQAAPATAGDVVTLIVAPFHSAVRLRAFTQAIRDLPEVTSTAPLDFRNATLVLEVQVCAALALRERLEHLDGFSLRVQAPGRGGQIWFIRLSEDDDPWSV